MNKHGKDSLMNIDFEVSMTTEEQRLKTLLNRCLEQFELEYGQNYMYLGTNIRTLIQDLKEEFKDTNNKD